MVIFTFRMENRHQHARYFRSNKENCKPSASCNQMIYHQRSDFKLSIFLAKTRGQHVRSVQAMHAAECGTGTYGMLYYKCNS